MYLLKEEYFDFFKEIRTSAYANYIGCDQTYVSSILNGNRTCSELIAPALISVKFDISFKNVSMTHYLEKYFAKEK